MKFLTYLYILTIVSFSSSFVVSAAELQTISALGAYRFSDQDIAMARKSAVHNAKINALKKYARSLPSPKKQIVSKNIGEFASRIDMLIPEIHIKSETIAEYSNSVKVAVIVKLDKDVTENLIHSYLK